MAARKSARTGASVFPPKRLRALVVTDHDGTGHRRPSRRLRWSIWLASAMRLPLQTRLEVVGTLARRGMLRPVRPDRMMRQALTFWRWGASLAAAYSVHGAGTPDQAAIADEKGRLTYGEVDLRTNSLAHSLRDLGVREADSRGAAVPQREGVRRAADRMLEARRRRALPEHVVLLAGAESRRRA